jgi:hypothetical protein
MDAGVLGVRLQIRYSRFEYLVFSHVQLHINVVDVTIRIWIMYGPVLQRLHQGCKISGDEMTQSETNVASNACIQGRIEELWILFESAGYSNSELPDPEGWLPTAVTSGHVYGQIAIRDQVNQIATEVTGRNRPYSDQQARNIARESGVWSRCRWLVDGIPIVEEPVLHQLVRTGVEKKKRRN